MKGISVVLTIILLVLATQLANHLRNSGKLPANHSHRDAAVSSLASKASATSQPARL
jgi:hypothetical protein